MTDLRVLVADDEAITRRGLRLILEHADGVSVVGEAADGAEAVRLTRELGPDIVLMDIRMPRMDGLAATERVVRLGARVLVLTTYDVDENLYRAFRAGASGFLLRPPTPRTSSTPCGSSPAGTPCSSPASHGASSRGSWPPRASGLSLRGWRA